MIKSKTSFQQFLQTLNASTLSPIFDGNTGDEGGGSGGGGESPKSVATSEQPTPSSDPAAPPGPAAKGALPPTGAPGDAVTRRSATMGHDHTTTVGSAYGDNTTTAADYFPGYWTDGDDPMAWSNGSYLGGYGANSTNYTAYNASDFELLNVNGTSTPYGYWFCAKWVEAQQDLFQAANLCFAVAFLIPKSFKQSILCVRALAAAGFLLLAAWAGTELCAPDVLTWNIVLVIVNSVHTILLIIRY